MVEYRYCFLFKIFKWRRSSLLTILLTSGSTQQRKNSILALALSTIYQLDPDVRRLVRRLKCLHLNILKMNKSAVFNQTCLDKVKSHFFVFCFIFHAFLFICKYILIKTYFSVRIIHSSVNFTSHDLYFSAIYDLMTGLCASLEHTVRFDAILDSLKRDIFARLK